MQPQDQRVEFGVVARGGGDLVDLRQPGVVHGPAGGRQAAGLVDLAGGVVLLVDQPVVLGVLVQAAQRGDQVLGGAAPAAGVAAGHRVRLDVRHELLDLRRRRLVQAPGAPLLDDPVPVGAVRPAGAVGDRGGHDRDVLGEGRHGRPVAGGRRSGRPGTGPSTSGPAAPRPRRPAGTRPGKPGWWSWLSSLRVRERAVGADGLVHHGERVGGEGVVGGERGQQHLVAGLQAAAAAQRGRDGDVGAGAAG